ncbi:O-antigen ligase family protein [Flavobacterium sp. MK4S-17]|uniref:O-antigen ligase family protein n=1 Tax=Flavobacterium sp. MK4S-17 TaxID=2543737 RepID=UPI00135CBC75|nr:O-antigen ligase family protein [Flavobacterium sp. MK4S-17]
MRISIKKYLLYSSIFAIFTELFYFKLGIDWKLLYLIIITNFVLLIRLKKLQFNKYFFLILAGLFIHAVIANTIIGVPYKYMLAQLIGITILGTYYYNFISLYKTSELIPVYLKMCLYAAILGYIMYFLRINLNDGRLQSIFTEPAHYVVVVLPACYYYLKQKQYWLFLIIFGTLILSNSSIGYIGCALMFVIPNLSVKRVVSLLAAVPLVIGILYYIYQEYPFFKMRVEETYESLNVINTGKFDDQTNLSSYALISNLNVARHNLEDHPLGSGIGSHVYMHNNVYYSGIRPPEYIRIQKKHLINSADANSLFTRMISEMGLLGLALIIFLLVKASKVYSSKEMALAQGIFIYFLLKLFREGHYFPPEFYFFIWLFYFIYQENKNQVKAEAA